MTPFGVFFLNIAQLKTSGESESVAVDRWKANMIKFQSPFWEVLSSGIYSTVSTLGVRMHSMFLMIFIIYYYFFIVLLSKL